MDAIGILDRLLHALLLAAGMAWQTGWSLVVGFVISGLLQVVAPAARIAGALGGQGVKPVALATVAGAASSSCSYAAASVSRTLFAKGASLPAALAFMFASTNLVVELGLILLLLMGWQFMAGEWIGGVVLVVVMSLLVRLTAPAGLVEEARAQAVRAGGKERAVEVTDGTLWERLARAETWAAVARAAWMDFRMLWKDLAIGFVVAGLLAAFVPDQWWQALFVRHAAPGWRLVADGLIGPLVAVLTFVCSIGNVPLAAMLWGAGVSFGGVLAFLYADLLVLPLLDVYRKYYGWKMAAYMAAVFYGSMVTAAVAVDLGFSALGLVPQLHGDMQARMMDFSLNYTFWLNVVFAGVALGLAVVARRHPAPSLRAHCCHHA